MRSKRRMTGPDFEAVRPLLNISNDRIAAARSALVDGQTLQGVANRYGWSRQAVGAAARIVWSTFQKFCESQRAAANAGVLLPPGWEQVVLIAPSTLIADFREQIAAAVPDKQPSTIDDPIGHKKRKSPERVSAPGRTSTQAKNR